MHPLVTDLEFLDCVWQCELLSEEALFKLKERRTALEASGRNVSLHELAREEKLLTDEIEARLAQWKAEHDAAPPPAAPTAPASEAPVPAPAPAPVADPFVIG